MAVDTAEKRFSMLNFGDGTHIHLTFQIDGSIDLDDQQHLLDLYSGIDFFFTPTVTELSAGAAASTEESAGAAGSDEDTTSNIAFQIEMMD